MFDSRDSGSMAVPACHQPARGQETAADRAAVQENA